MYFSYGAEGAVDRSAAGRHSHQKRKLYFLFSADDLYSGERHIVADFLFYFPQIKRMKKRIFWLVVILIAGFACLSFLFFPDAARPKKESSFIVRVRVLHDAGKPTIVKKDESVIVNGTEYRGEADVVKTESGFDVINRVELEDYLKGVLPREMHHMWPSSALKAQAVASRSFAVYEAIRRKDKEYDLTADTFSQVYGGKGSEKWRATRAVEATKGEVRIRIPYATFR